ncbi:putative solute:sodium symporter small subunit [Natronincola peptidivorans]|uniref:Putative solute:sodium symporter small subunit n=1 Tax=Natronincola peptidivorans TaxID=426128 RepID=A0A1I0H0F2_9FIRM|nr:DUF4212 domain-containing protein [Natronincola peptidivorans]SET76991.1 putative solute:sodium symporter small subunit [Natronincola peptidivorans]
MENQKKAQQSYWNKNLKIISSLLAIWASVSYVAVILLGDVLSGVSFFGVTLSFWLAHQGAILVFVGIIIVYVLCMDLLDKDVSIKRTESTKGGV